MTRPNSLLRPSGAAVNTDTRDGRPRSSRARHPRRIPSTRNDPSRTSRDRCPARSPGTRHANMGLRTRRSCTDRTYGNSTTLHVNHRASRKDQPQCPRRSATRSIIPLRPARTRTPTIWLRLSRATSTVTKSLGSARPVRRGTPTVGWAEQLSEELRRSAGT